MLHRRRFCLVCSPFGAHNTSKVPFGALAGRELASYRRRRKAVTTYRSQKKRRRELKADLIIERGGRCLDCGYAGSNTALEFHHRDAKSKEFAIGSSSASRDRLWAEAAKCDLVCANCHRARHAATRGTGGGAVVAGRRRTKQRAVELLGGRCEGCGSAVMVAAFEFHHRDAGTKEFAISADGVPRRWALIVAELGKCVLLCANCHREVHAEVVIGAVDAQRIPVSAWSSTSV
ncbi:MAG: hypothetical protein NVSMB8_11760 [Candidatus Limnocylindrales bacterium]